MIVEPEAVLGSCPGTGENLRGTDVLIQWNVLPILEATREPFGLINQQFPSFHLEDKVSLAEQGNDKLPIHKTYKRRNRAGEAEKGKKENSNGSGEYHMGPRNFN
ncbi:Ribonuclease H-like domain containing protein [Abeliophyllum distichum]|uniref:Ribonuclease H-like domain containing protein n=1 Tax=Abeliophyllum distichum TaxID=126358 RepID=A0ABD1RCG1_9LAMI